MPFNKQSRGVIMMKSFKKYDEKNAAVSAAAFIQFQYVQLLTLL